jgi:acyl-homoserine lactone acylase PvdQ
MGLGRRRALGLALLLTSLGAPTTSHAAGAFGDAGGFRNVLAVGQGGTATTADVLASTTLGQVPASFTNQLPEYRDLLYAAPGLTDADLPKFFKDASFGEPADGLVETPKPGVRIVRDRRYGVPRVFGTTRADTMWGAGYVSGQERLLTMDVLRRFGRGRLSELTGAGRNDSRLLTDAAQLLATGYTEEELQAQIDRAGRFGAVGLQAKQDLVDFTAGVNAWIAETRRDPSKLPGEYGLLNQTPQDWKPTDSVAAASLIGGIFCRFVGGEHRNGEVLAELMKRVGKAKARPVFDDLRRREDPEAPVTVTKRFRYPDPTGKADPRAVAIPDAGSVRRFDPLKPDGGTTSAAASRTAPPERTSGPGGIPLASNVLLASGAATASGRPVAVMGPQVEFYAPQILFEMELHGPGIDARGATFPGLSFVVLIGRGKDYAWSATTATTDVVDVFAEELCDPDGGQVTRDERHYRYKGRCVAMDVREEVLRIPTSPGGNTGAPRTVRLAYRRTVHGPVQATGTVGGKPVAFVEQRSSFGREVDSVVAFSKLNSSISGPEDFRRTMRGVNFAFNWFYVGPKSIAYQTSGTYPLRARGTDPDLPAWGTGRWDWQGFDPRTREFRALPGSRQPQGQDPANRLIVNWNGKQAPGWRAADDQWAYGSVQRVERLLDPLVRDLRAGRKLDRRRLVQVMELAATQDVRGQEVVPWIVRVLRGSTDRRVVALRDLLDRWSRSGAQRRDLDKDNVFEDSAAVALMDEWEPRLVRAIFEPRIGKAAMDRAVVINPLRDAPQDNKGSAFGSGWYGQVQKDLRSVLGRKVRGPLSRRYCGRGRLAACRAVLERSLLEAFEAVAKAQGTEDPGAWKVVSTCPPRPSDRQLPKACDQIEFQALGGVTMPPIPWQDRPTFQQVVEVGAGG